MSPLFMETGYEPNSPDSTSAEDCNSQTSEREGDGRPAGKMGTKRREKNRDAARKSRKKQTERADVLHEELQRLERSNSAFHKEIAGLKKDLLLYTAALKRHEPHCCLRESGPSSGSPPLCRASPPIPGGCKAASGPAKAPPQASLPAARSLSTSSNPGLGHQTLDSVNDGPFSSPGATPDLFVAASSCNPGTAPCSLPLPDPPPPHSLFSDAPTPTKVRPLAAFDAGPDPHCVRDSVQKSSFFSPLQSDTLGAFLSRQTPFPAAPADALPPYHVATQNLRLAQGCRSNNNVYTRNPHNPGAFLPSALPDRALQSYSASPQANFPAFPLKPSCSQQSTASAPASLLSLLTVPSPLNVPQTTSSGFTRSIAQAPPLHDPANDLSLSELLEVNEWILSDN